MNSNHLKSQRQQIPVADSRKMAAGIDEFDYLLHSGASTKGFLRVRTLLHQTP